MATVDSYSEANKDASTYILAVHPSPGTGVSAVGQSFTGDGTKLSCVVFYLGNKFGSPGGLTARLYAHSGTFGTSSVPTGNALASSNEVAASVVPASIFALVAFNFPTPYILANGTKYCIVLEASSGTWSASNDVEVGYDGSSPSHAGNYFQYTSAGWAANSGRDTIFYVCSGEQVYYFNSKSTSNWTNSAYMVDNILSNYATATSDVIETLDANDCPGTNLGMITKVEVRGFGYADADDELEFRPIFSGGNGNLHEVAPGISPIWVAWQDITTDPNAPSPWIWALVQTLDMYVGRDAVGKGNTMRCAKVEIRVTYGPYPEVHRHGFVNFQDPGVV